jgi:subtilase family serine protease
MSRCSRYSLVQFDRYEQSFSEQRKHRSITNELTKLKIYYRKNAKLIPFPYSAIIASIVAISLNNTSISNLFWKIRSARCRCRIPHRSSESPNISPSSTLPVLRYLAAFPLPFEDLVGWSDSLDGPASTVSQAPTARTLVTMVTIAVSMIMLKSSVMNLVWGAKSVSCPFPSPFPLSSAPSATPCPSSIPVRPECTSRTSKPLV